MNHTSETQTTAEGPSWVNRSGWRLGSSLCVECFSSSWLSFLKWHGSWKTTGKVSEWTCVTGQSDFHIITELNRFLLVTVFFGLNHNPPEWLVTVGFWTSNGEKGFAGLLQSTRRPPRSCSGHFYWCMETYTVGEWLESWCVKQKKISWGIETFCPGNIPASSLRPLPVHSSCWQSWANSRLPLNHTGQVAPALGWNHAVTSALLNARLPFKHFTSDPHLLLRPLARGPSLKRTSRTCF